MPEGTGGDAAAADDIGGIIGDGASHWLASEAFIIIFLSVGIFSQKKNNELLVVVSRHLFAGGMNINSF